MRRTVAGILLGLVALGLCGLAALLAVAEVGHFSTYGCFFAPSGFVACPDGATGGGILVFALGELVLLAPAALVARAAYRRIRPHARSGAESGQGAHA